MDIVFDYSDAPLTRNEQTSVKALVAWVAHQKGMHDEIPMHYVAAKFGVDDIAHIKRRDYEDVIRFLVDNHEEIQVN